LIGIIDIGWSMDGDQTIPVRLKVHLLDDRPMPCPVEIGHQCVNHHIAGENDP
jgi:hypothetical protein